MSSWTSGGPVAWIAVMDLEGLATVSALRVIAARVKVHVIGDPTQQGITVEGPHTIERVDGTAVVRSDPPADRYFDEVLGDFTTGVRFRLGDWIASRARDWRPRIVIRVAPDVPVDATVALGGVEIESMSSQVRCQVSRGAAWLHELGGPFDAAVSTGRVTVRGDVSHGSSTIRCERGAAIVELSSGSNVRVLSEADPGKVTVKGGTWDGSGWTFGVGSATLTLDLRLGSAEVAIEDPAEPWPPITFLD